MRVRITTYIYVGKRKTKVPYTSFKWDKDMTVGEFAWKISNYSRKAVKIGDGYINVGASSLKYPQLETTCVAKGEWIVFDNKRRIVGTYDDKGHEEEYEIVADWR